MKTREEVARFVEYQFDPYSTYECKLNKGGCHHYGKQDVRELLDFIFEGMPTTEVEKVVGKQLRNSHRP